MTHVNFQNHPVNTVGALPTIGSKAPKFTLTKTDLTETSLSDFAGKNIILSIFPSLDTPTCANSVRKFNSTANQLKDTEILCISMDLPFAQKRFCGAEGLNQVTPVSAFRHPEFGDVYGITIADSKLKGLLARAIIIIDKTGTVIYTELVTEITEEPNYDEALAALK